MVVDGLSVVFAGLFVAFVRFTVGDGLVVVAQINGIFRVPWGGGGVLFDI